MSKYDSEKVVKAIRRRTRRKYSAEEKRLLLKLIRLFLTVIKFDIDQNNTKDTVYLHRDKSNVIILEK